MIRFGIKPIDALSDARDTDGTPSQGWIMLPQDVPPSPAQAILSGGLQPPGAVPPSVSSPTPSSIPDSGLQQTDVVSKSALPPAPPVSGGFIQPSDTVLYAPDGGSGGHAGGTGGGTSSPSTTSTTSSTSAFVINISWDSSVSSAPTGFTTAVLAASQYLESQFTDAVTLNISVGYGEVNGTSLGSNALGTSQTFLNSYSYNAITGALATDATSADDKAAIASLSATAPVNGTFWNTTAQAKAIGLASAGGTSTDGYVGFSSSLPFTFNDSTGVASGTYDFNGVALHELTEVMGRQMLTGGTIGSYANSYDLLDLFHYASPGVRDFSASTPGYLSFDSGTTNVGVFNTTSGGDSGDWSSAMGNDSFDAFSNSGVVNPVTTNDLRELDVLGWNLAGVPTPVSVSTPTGVAITPTPSALANSQNSSGLSAAAAVAGVAQTGGSSSDTYSFALGGSASGAFTLTGASGTTATLAVGAGGLAGAAGGQLYALTITATDTTSGGIGPASGIDFIVGSGSADTVSVAALTSGLGLSTATPTFVYGLAGNDSLNASGMTGRMWFVGGAGADTLTGGSGVNDYLYGAVADSTPGSMDVITNFHAAADLIDLSGLGLTLSNAGKIGSHTSKLGTDSFGWQTSGGNTFVYINTSSATEALSSTNMKIELVGSVSLGTANFAHL